MRVDFQQSSPGSMAGMEIRCSIDTPGNGSVETEYRLQLTRDGVEVVGAPKDPAPRCPSRSPQATGASWSSAYRSRCSAHMPTSRSGCNSAMGRRAPAPRRAGAGLDPVHAGRIRRLTWNGVLMAASRPLDYRKVVRRKCGWRGLQVRRCRSPPLRGPQACGVHARVDARRLIDAAVTFKGVAMADVAGHQSW